MGVDRGVGFAPEGGGWVVLGGGMVLELAVDVFRRYGFGIVECVRGGLFEVSLEVVCCVGRVEVGGGVEVVDWCEVGMVVVFCWLIMAAAVWNVGYKEFCWTWVVVGHGVSLVWLVVRLFP